MQPNIILVQLQPKLIVSIYDKYLKQSKKIGLCNIWIMRFINFTTPLRPELKIGKKFGS